MPRPPQPPVSRPIGLTLARTAKAVSRVFDDALSASGGSLPSRISQLGSEPPDALSASGGSLPSWLILLSLKTGKPSNQRELAEAVGIRGATLTHHLNAMESDGLIGRSRDPANRRVQHVVLTERGDALFLRLAGAATSHDQRLRTGFSEQELATLEELLDRLRRNVSDNPDEDTESTD